MSHSLIYNEASLLYPIYVVTARPDDNQQVVMNLLHKQCAQGRSMWTKWLREARKASQESKNVILDAIFTFCGVARRSKTSYALLRDSIHRIVTADCCVQIMKDIAFTGASTDDLCHTLMKLWRIDPPTEVELQTLSLLQQAVAGNGGEVEFAVTTLWLCAMQTIIEMELRQRMPNCKSEASLHSKRAAKIRRAATI